MLKKKNDKYILSTVLTAVGKIFLFISIPFIILLLYFGVFLQDEVMFIILIIPGLFLLMGLLFLAFSKKIIIDTNKREVRLKKAKIPFSDIGGIQILSQIRTYYQNNQKEESLVWQVFIVTKAFNSAMEEKSTAINRILDEIGENEITEGQKRQVEQLVEEQFDLVDSGIGSDLFLLAESPSELEVWQTTETLARLFNVPILDGSNEFIEKREVHEHDLSFAEKIKMGNIIPPDEIKKPDTIRVEDQWLKKSVIWEEPNEGLIAGGVALLFVFGIALLIVLLASAHKFILPSLIGTAIGGVMLKCGLVRRPRTLLMDISDRSLLYLKGKSNKRIAEMSFNDLESVRVYEEPHPCITLMSDKKLITIYTKAENAFWMYKWLYDNFSAI